MFPLAKPKERACLYSFDAEEDICVCGCACKIRALNVGLADHARHADPLVCANGFYKVAVRRCEYILEMLNNGDVNGDLLCGLVGSSDFTPALHCIAAHREIEFQGLSTACERGVSSSRGDRPAHGAFAREVCQLAY